MMGFCYGNGLCINFLHNPISRRVIHNGYPKAEALTHWDKVSLAGHVRSLRSEPVNPETIIQALQEGSMIAYLGPDIFKGSLMPSSTEETILALNGGRAMTPKLMQEVSKAAMSIEQRRGRGHIEGMCIDVFGREKNLQPAHALLLGLGVKVIIDTNRDSLLLDALSSCKHFLLKGIARISASPKRYVLYVWEAGAYVEAQTWDEQAPLIIKPMGCALPTPSFVICDADYVDWLTEAMGGFAYPEWFKAYRKDKTILYLGESFAKDTQRMVARETTLGCAGGVLVHEEPLGKAELRFVEGQGLLTQQCSTEGFVEVLKTALQKGA